MSNDNEQLISEYKGPVIDVTIIAHYITSHYHSATQVAGQSAEWTVWMWYTKWYKVTTDSCQVK